MHERDIKVLSAMYGYDDGTIITSSMTTVYDQFKNWAEWESTTTADGKAVKICEFIEEKSESIKEKKVIEKTITKDAISVLMDAKDAVEMILKMETVEDITKFTIGDNRKIVRTAIGKKFESLKGNVPDVQTAN